METIEKSGVFISHISEEKSVAINLKRLLRNAFGREFRVFVSSDYDSLSGGDFWFTRIIESLKTVKVVLVLISEHSTERKWINFEAGVGVGAEAKVIPIVFRGFGKDRLGFPLSGLQARNLGEMGDLRGILADIKSSTGESPQFVNLDIFIEEIQEIENTLPATNVIMTPRFVPYGDSVEVCFTLENSGHKDMEMVRIWTKIPESLKFSSTYSFQPVPPALMVEETNEDGRRNININYWAGKDASPGAYYRSNFVTLPNHITVSMFPYEVTEMKFRLKSTISESELSEIIEYGFDAKGYSFKKALSVRDHLKFESVLESAL
jgi:hypothetical protein